MQNEGVLSLAHPIDVRILELLPTEDDLILITLKGHLIIENALRDMVKMGLRHPEFLNLDNKRTDMTFARLLRIAKSIWYDGEHECQWEAIHALNGIRNCFAHNITPPSIEVDGRVQDVIKPWKDSSPNDFVGMITEFDHLRLAVAACHGFIKIVQQTGLAFSRPNSSVG